MMNLFGCIELFFVLFSFTLSCLLEQLDDVIFYYRNKEWGHDLLFAFYLWFSCNDMKHTYKWGVHYKSLFLVLDAHVYLDSFYMHKLVRFVLLFSCWSELFML